MEAGVVGVTDGSSGIIVRLVKVPVVGVGAMCGHQRVLCFVCLGIVA